MGYFGEGPVSDARNSRFLWTDIIGDTIWRGISGGRQASPHPPSSHANGMTFDRDGRLVVAGWSARTIWRVEKDGSLVTIASRYQGKKFNSPNDIVVRSDGSVYWTELGRRPRDPRHGRRRPAAATGYPGRVPPHAARRGETHRRGHRLSQWACASARTKSILYVNDTRLGLIRAFDVNADGSVRNGRVFHTLTGTEAGVADGMKCDQEGNVYCTGPGGIHVMDANGALIGRLRIPGHATKSGLGRRRLALALRDHLPLRLPHAD